MEEAEGGQPLPSDPPLLHEPEELSEPVAAVAAAKARNNEPQQNNSSFMANLGA